MKVTYSIAILGNFTTDFLSLALHSECKKRDIKASFYNSPYRQYNQQIMAYNSDFYRAEPDLAILLLDGRTLFPEWFRFSTIADKDAEELDSRVRNVMDMLENILITIHCNSNTKIIINNFRVPYHSPLGILDNRISRDIPGKKTGRGAQENYPYRIMGLKRMITGLNVKLEDFAAATDFAYVFDFNGFCSNIGLENLSESKMTYLTGNPMSHHATKLLSGEYMRYILPFMSLNKKCLVLDLDNTLWGGMAGEDGISGVKLDLSGPGRCYYDFQEELLNLYDKGILLAINSKNNEKDALEIIENHPHMLLRKKFFSSIKINWQDKATNLRDIAGELNIGLDSFVFFDDNPVEREYIKEVLSQVTVVNVPEDPGKYCDALNSVPDFERLDITSEDRKRNAMVEQDHQRIRTRQSFRDIEDYLASLETSIIISKADDFNIPRISQLTLKTNQFNMTTKRYHVQDIKLKLEAGNYLVYCCSVTDKFGDSGITGSCIIRLEGSAARIDTFLLSCRVLGRNVEYAFLSEIIKQLRENGVEKVYAEYLPTDKNTANSSFYTKAGFAVIASDEDRIDYLMDKDAVLKEIDYIRVVMGSVGLK